MKRRRGGGKGEGRKERGRAVSYTRPPNLHHFVLNLLKVWFTTTPTKAVLGINTTTQRSLVSRRGVPQVWEIPQDFRSEVSGGRGVKSRGSLRDAAPDHQ